MSARVGQPRWGRLPTRPRQERALRAVQLGVEEQSVDATDAQIAYARAGADCAAAGGSSPMLTPGGVSVCVTETVRIPLLPKFNDANTATGLLTIERDRYVDGCVRVAAGPGPKSVTSVRSQKRTNQERSVPADDFRGQGTENTWTPRSDARNAERP